jgi:SET domain-containing protein
MAPMPASYLSPKTHVRPSPIEGKGLFARRRIRRGEIVAIKGGHVYDARTLAKIKRRIAASYIQIADGVFFGARAAAEVRRNKMFINHSCAPNLGIRGQIVFVALRDIRAGEELTYDWAMEENRRDPTRCRCGARGCRGVLSGRDWTIPRLQRRYRGYFSSYLEDKIRASAR